jgi:hypothetical protein
VHVRAVDEQSGERAFQVVERQTGVDQGAERHVAGDAGEAIEIEDAAQKNPASLKL